MNFSENLKSTFHKVSDALFADLKSNEEANLNLHGEDSLFVRFNNNKVRQNTHVEQMSLGLMLNKNQRTSSVNFSITGNLEDDLKRALHWLGEARQECELLPEDPFQVAILNNGASEVSHKGCLMPDQDLISAITGPAHGADLAGIYSGGPLIAANRNSKGQNHWFSTENFSFDYSLYSGEKAVKGLYGGTEWIQCELQNKIQESKNLLSLMSRPKKVVPPGAYRCYLAPAAVSEIATMFYWEAFSYNSYRQGTSAFKRLADKEKSLSPMFNLRENYGLGLTHAFNSIGEVAPNELDLIRQGHLETLLVSSRSAKEYSLTGNKAESNESPRSLEILGGSLEQKDILKELGTGLYLSNLHYINWSDRMNARITGMTRYACFWVENGEIQAPIADLRFDESLYDCFGENLVALTRKQEVEPTTDTYESRSFGGSKIPGMLINNFKFTL